MHFGGKFLIGLVVALCACQHRDSGSSPSANLAKDGRNDLLDQYLIKRMGVLSFKGVPICTAFASGTNQVSTAASCLREPLSDAYKLNINGRPVPIVAALADLPTGLALLKVEGVSEVFPTAAFASDEDSSIVSYASDQKQFVLASTGYIKTSAVPGVLMHTFDAIKGASGSPILQNGQVVGVHLGAVVEDDNVFNVAVATADLEDVNLPQSDLRLHSEAWWLAPSTDGALREEKSIAICGKSIAVPIWAYIGCQSSSLLLPVNCKGAALPTEAGLCHANVAIVAGFCGVNDAAVPELSAACARMHARKP
jgi:hypothetical protein